MVEAECVSKEFAKLSLLVFDQNKGAKALYGRFGYSAVGRLEVVPHPMFHYSGDVLLMAKKLST